MKFAVAGPVKLDPRRTLARVKRKLNVLFLEEKIKILTFLNEPSMKSSKNLFLPHAF